MFAKIRTEGRSLAVLVGGLAVIVAVAAVVAGGAQAAKPGNSPNAKLCQKGGWEDLARSEDHSGFSSEHECVSYAAQGGTLVHPLALCKQQLADADLTAPANPNYILGTPGDDDFASQMTTGNDVICGFAGDDTIDPHTTDKALNAGDIFLGGDGADYVNVVYGTFNGGDGNDHVAFLDGTFNGGDGNDTVTHLHRVATFNGDSGNDTVDQMNGGTFNGDSGDDSVETLTFGTFNGGDGCDTVTNLAGGTFNGGDQSTCPA